MKKILIVILCIICILFGGSCKKQEKFQLYTDFQINDTLPFGNNEKAKVIILLGQSNASGVSISEYLKNNVTNEQYKKYQNGNENILINYFVDNQNNTSNGEFVKVNDKCGSTKEYFGPEVGINEVLSNHYSNEKIFILKYTFSGTNLNNNWLNEGKRGTLYNACIKFVLTNLDYLIKKKYDITVDAICFMQGESDSNEKYVNNYYQNLCNFVSYLRSDLEEYKNEKGIYFIDAGISNSSIWSPYYEKINEMKEQFSKGSTLNIYFSTIDSGLTFDLEPANNPDLAHYDSLSEIKLGQLFGEKIVAVLKN